VLSYGKNLHLLKLSMTFATDPHFQKFELTSTASFESNIRFDLDQKRDSLLVTDDQSKSLRSYSLSEFLKSKQQPATTEENKESALKLTAQS